MRSNAVGNSLAVDTETCYPTFCCHTYALAELCHLYTQTTNYVITQSTTSKNHYIPRLHKYLWIDQTLHILHRRAPSPLTDTNTGKRKSHYPCIYLIYSGSPRGTPHTLDSSMHACHAWVGCDSSSCSCIPIRHTTPSPRRSVTITRQIGPCRRTRSLFLFGEYYYRG